MSAVHYFAAYDFDLSLSVSECDPPIVPISATSRRSTNTAGGSTSSTRKPNVTAHQDRNRALSGSERSAPDRNAPGPDTGAAANLTSTAPAPSATPLGLIDPAHNDTSTVPKPNPAMAALSTSASDLGNGDSFATGASDLSSTVRALDIGASDPANAMPGIISDASDLNNAPLDGGVSAPNTGATDPANAALNCHSAVPDPASAALALDIGASDPASSIPGIISDTGSGTLILDTTDPAKATLDSDSAMPGIISGASDPANTPIIGAGSDALVPNIGASDPRNGGSSDPGNAALDINTGAPDPANAMSGIVSGPSSGPTGASDPNNGGGAIDLTNDTVAHAPVEPSSAVPAIISGASSATPVTAGARLYKGKQRAHPSGRPPLNTIKKPLIIDSTHVAMDSPGSYFYRPPLHVRSVR